MDLVLGFLLPLPANVVTCARFQTTSGVWVDRTGALDWTALLFHEGAWWASLAKLRLWVQGSVLRGLRAEELWEVPEELRGLLAVEALCRLMVWQATQSGVVLYNVAEATYLVQELLWARTQHRRIHSCPCQTLVRNLSARSEVMTHSFLGAFTFARNELQDFVETTTLDCSSIVKSSVVEVPGCPWLSVCLTLCIESEEKFLECCGSKVKPSNTQRTWKVCKDGRLDLPAWVGLEAEVLVRSDALLSRRRGTRVQPCVAVDCSCLRSGVRVSNRFSGWGEEEEAIQHSSGRWQRPLNMICSDGGSAKSMIDLGSDEAEVRCAVHVWSIFDGKLCRWPLTPA